MPKYVHFNGQKFISVSGQLFLLDNFWLKCKNLLFLRKNDFVCIFDRFEVQVVTVWSNQIGKTQNIYIFAYGSFFTRF